jgi:hypothetical protein
MSRNIQLPGFGNKKDIEIVESHLRMKKKRKNIYGHTTTISKIGEMIMECIEKINFVKRIIDSCYIS